MTPVISPWVFYAISVADGLCVVFTVVSTALACFAVIARLISLLDYGDDDYSKLKASAKVSTVLAAVFVSAAILIPSENTITKMIVAQNVTYERVEAVGDVVETVYSDIMELME